MKRSGLGARRGVGPVFVLLSLALLVSACGERLPATAGARGIGDPYYPALGNGGYDVTHYTLALDVDPLTNEVTAQTTIDATAAQTLGSFSLDFEGLAVDAVTVNRREARYETDGAKLVITPGAPLHTGKPFRVIVRYHGQPGPADAIMTEKVDKVLGWAHADDGTINVFSEPNGARGWYPVNDHPRDKASYRFEVTVPEPWVVAAPGEGTQVTLADGRTRYVFEMGRPMASYLAAINIGKYDIEALQGPAGIAIRNYFPQDYPPNRRQHFEELPEMIEFLAGLFGPYPFNEYGVVIASADNPACQSDFGALEAQTLSIHCPEAEMAADYVIVHELAHQWFGDSVSLENWKDLWLKEGMATYAEWLWAARGKDAAVLNKVVRAQSATYAPSAPVGEPGADVLYRRDVYTGGALVWHALRVEVGDEAFFKILRTYLERYRDGNAGTEDLVAVAKEVTGRELSQQFDEWLTKIGEPQQVKG